jgi:hypothetical protein
VLGWPTGIALAKRSKVLERIDAARVAIEPCQTQGVSPDCGDVVELTLIVGRLEELDAAIVPLTSRARAIAPEYLVRINALVAVAPVDLGLSTAPG